MAESALPELRRCSENPLGGWLVRAAGTLDLKLAERAKWQIAGEYVDHGISGAKSRGKRPEFDRLIKAPPGGSSTCDGSLQGLVAFGDLHVQGVDLFLHIQGMDTTTPAARRCSR